LLRPLFAVSFRETPRLDWLLSAEFAEEFRNALCQLKWAPPTVETELRPIYARLRALETQVSTLVRGLQTPEASQAAATKSRARTRNRRASHFLAQLTDGELLRLRLGGNGQARVVTREGEMLAVESLWSTQRDLVYISLCLALTSALARHGVRLPLVLDEPFARLDARSAAALVDILDGFAASGQQVIVFTGRPEVARRFAEIGANVREMESLRRERRVAAAKPPAAEESEPNVRPMRRRVKTTRVERREAG
jgi:DNA repair exonuclease SbcCD ATPase subunit